MMPLDAVIRYGGEEFLIILTEVDIRKAGEVAERIRQSVMNLQLEYESSPK